MLKAHRGQYFVEYHCGTSGIGFAILNVIFPTNAADIPYVREIMERELDAWLKRYPVPIMVHGIDGKEDTISLSSEFDKSALMGYVDFSSGQIVRRWGLFKDSEMPADQKSESYLDNVYRDVPFRWASDVREAANRKQRSLVRGTKILLFFIVVVPLLIAVLALYIDWLGYVLAAISIGAGLFKAAKAFGFWKPSPREQAKARDELQMKHHHYHCERNPRAFERPRAENFEHEAEERIRQDDAKLRPAIKSAG